MKRKLWLCITIFTVFPPSAVFCQNRSVGNSADYPVAVASLAGNVNSADNNAGIKIISFFFKILAKGFVSTTDLDKLKTNSISKINNMSPESFHARYLDFYEHVYDCHFFTDTYGLHKEMTKAEAVEKIRSLNKTKLYAIINALPDTVISNEFKRFLFKNKQEAPERKNASWIMDRLNKMFEYLKEKYL